MVILQQGEAGRWSLVAGRWSESSRWGYTVSRTMPRTVKTAISPDRELFEQADPVAAALRISRSGVMGLALEEFLRRRENRRLLERINRAHAEAPAAEERAVLDNMLTEGARLPDGEW